MGVRCPGCLVLPAIPGTWILPRSRGQMVNIFDTVPDTVPDTVAVRLQGGLEKTEKVNISLSKSMISRSRGTPF